MLPVFLWSLGCEWIRKPQAWPGPEPEHAAIAGAVGRVQSGGGGRDFGYYERLDRI